MHLSWQLRFTRLFIVIGEIVFGIKNHNKCVRFVFRKVRIIGQQNYVEGDIKKMKLEFGQNISVEATSTGGDYQRGTAAFTVQAADASENDVTDQFTVEVDPENELKANIVRAEGNDTECSGVVTLRADGDPDAAEEAPIVGTLAFNYDSPNATGFDLVGSVAVEEAPPAPEETIEPV